MLNFVPLLIVFPLIRNLIKKIEINLQKWVKLGLCYTLEGWDGKGGSRGRGHIYTYGRFMLMFDRNQQNSVKQLSFS